MKSIYGVFSFLLVIVGALNCKAEVAGEWRLHPSADMFSFGTNTNNCVKIIDGKRYVYYQLHTSYFDKRSEPYNQETTSLFRFDKENPNRGIYPLSSDYEVSGNDIAFFEYSVEGEYCVVAYRSGILDIFKDTGEFVSSVGISNVVGPGLKEINSLTTDIDGSKIYLASGFGYCVIDARTGDLMGIANYGKNTQYATRVGEKVIFIVDNTFYALDCDHFPYKLDKNAKLVVDQTYLKTNYLTQYGNEDGTLLNPNGIYPLTENAFLYTVQNPGGEYWSAKIFVVYNDDNKYTVFDSKLKFENYSSWGINPNTPYKFINNGMIVPSRSGYLYLGLGTDFYIINKGIDPDISNKNYADVFRKDVFRSIPKTDFQKTLSGALEACLRSASWDGENFWFYYPREGFKTRSVYLNGNNASWSDVSEAIVPNAPLAYRAESLSWHPRYGMLVRNHGMDKKYDGATDQADGLSAYKDGTWKYLGLPKTNFNERVRVPNPRGVVVDPIDDKYIWGASKEHGMIRLNTEDPNDILHMSRTTSAYRSRPGFVAVHPTQSEWPNLSCFARIKFDRDNTMWTAYTDWQLYGTSETAAKLWYWTEDDRRASINCNKDASLYKPMGEIVVPTSSMLYTGEVYPMNLDVNKNLVGWTPGHYYEAFVLDHNGTLSDTSDDKIAYIVDIFDKTNTKLDLHHPVYMFEDPYDGAILVSYSAGVLVTSREQLFQQKKRGEWLQVENDPAGIVGRPIAQGEVTGIAVDALGRKWIATVDDGLYCLSEDRKTLLGHYTASTSMLPTDMCLGIAYNPDTNSIFIGTDAGIAEFIPAGSVSSSRDKSVTVVPAVVEPHFKGHVTVSGLTDGIKYSVIAPSGLLYGEPMESSNGRIQVEFSANTHFSGEYSIVDTDGNIAVTFIVLK